MGIPFVGMVTAGLRYPRPRHCLDARCVRKVPVFQRNSITNSFRNIIKEVRVSFSKAYVMGGQDGANYFSSLEEYIIPLTLFAILKQ
jgi:hypothetical protein